LNRINESIKAFVARWNMHSLKLPRSAVYTDPATGRHVRSMIPSELQQTHPRNYSRHGLLTFFDNNPDIKDELIGEHDNDEEEHEFPKVEVKEALWELSAEALYQFQHTFEPLALHDSHELCKERYRQAIRSLFI